MLYLLIINYYVIKEKKKKKRDAKIQRVTSIKQKCLYWEGRYIDEYLKISICTYGLFIYRYMIKCTGCCKMKLEEIVWNWPNTYKNKILCIVRVWSLFCSKFLFCTYSLRKLVLRLLVFPVLSVWSVFWIWFHHHRFNNICIMIVFINARCSVNLLSRWFLKTKNECYGMSIRAHN